MRSNASVRTGRSARPFVGHGEATGQTFEERGAQPLLQRSDLLAHGRLGDVQFERGARKAQMSRGRLEGTQRIQREIRSHDEGIRFSWGSTNLSSFAIGCGKTDSCGFT